MATKVHGPFSIFVQQNTVSKMSIESIIKNVWEISIKFYFPEQNMNTIIHQSRK